MNKLGFKKDEDWSKPTIYLANMYITIHCLRISNILTTTKHFLLKII